MDRLMSAASPAESRKPQHSGENSGNNHSAARLRRAGAGRLGPSGADHARRSRRFVFLFSEAQRSGKTGAAIRRGEFGLLESA